MYNINVRLYKIYLAISMDNKNTIIIHAISKSTSAINYRTGLVKFKL